MSSGDDIEAGRVTGAEGTTILNGGKPVEGDVDFDGDIVFIAQPHFGAEKPSHTLHGVLGVGWGATGFGGGAGVIGDGGPNAGTGVVGRGGQGAKDSGGPDPQGGVGVHGIGGSVPFVFSDVPPATVKFNPGTGVIGQGGRWSNIRNTRQMQHGAGLIGIGGGAPAPSDDPPPPAGSTAGFIPSIQESGGVGVYGQGADAEITQVVVNGVAMPSGPRHPGIGVLGKGGVQISGTSMEPGLSASRGE
jgi:hypothetical protein